MNMKHNISARLGAGLLLACVASAAFAGPSTINTGQPATDSGLNSLVVRQLALSAASDINNLIGMNGGVSCPGSPVVGQDCLLISSNPYTWQKWTGAGGWATIGTINPSTGVFSPSLGTTAITATLPLTAAFSGGAVTLGINLDGNFTVNGSNSLAFTPIASGNLLANCTGSSAEPTLSTFTSCMDRNIGSTSGMFPLRGASVWGSGTLGANVAAFLATPSSANLASALTDETGTGAAVFATSPTLVTPSLGAASATSLASGPVTVTSASAAALAIGLNGATNPAFQVDASTALQAAGIKVTGAVAGGQSSINVIDSAAASSLDINAKGTGALRLQANATGAIYLGLLNSTVNIGTSGASVLNIGSSGLASGTLTIAGSVAGASTILAPSSGGGTATLFAGTDTFAGLATVQSLTHTTFAASTDVLGGVTMTVGSDAEGDIYYRHSGILTRLPIGSSAALLTVSGGIPAWVAAPGGGNVSNTGTPVINQIAQWTNATTVQGVNLASLLTPGTGISITGTTTPTINNTGVTSVSGAGMASGTVTTTGNLTVTAAVEADQKTATSTTLGVTPSAQQYHPSAVQAHGYFNGSTGAAVGTAYNITSLTVGGSGAYTVNFGTNFWADTSYACHVTASGLPVAFEGATHTRSAWAFTTQNTSFAGANAGNVNVICSGPLT